jgi:hypothetical protein
MKKDEAKKGEEKQKDKKELDMEQLDEVSGGTQDLNAPPSKHKRIDINRRG